MAIVPETRESLKRFKQYADELSALCERYGIKGLRAPGQLMKAYGSDHAFRSECNSIFERIAKAEGGKIALTTAGAIIGMALGGIGLAAAGTAIGLPLAAILAPAGYILGNEIDDVLSRDPIVGQPSISSSSQRQDPQIEKTVEDCELFYGPNVAAGLAPLHFETKDNTRKIALLIGWHEVLAAETKRELDFLESNIEAEVVRFQRDVGELASAIEATRQSGETKLAEMQRQVLELVRCHGMAENRAAEMHSELTKIRATLRSTQIAAMIGLFSIGCAVVWLIARR